MSRNVRRPSVPDTSRRSPPSAALPAGAILPGLLLGGLLLPGLVFGGLATAGAGSLPLLEPQDASPEAHVKAGENGRVEIAPETRTTVPVILDMSRADGLAISELTVEVTWPTDRFSFVSSETAEVDGVTFDESATGTGTLTADVTSASGITETTTAFRVTLEAGATEGNTSVGVSVTAASDDGGNDVLDQVGTRDLSVCVGAEGLFGDVNSDDRVNILDAQIIARFAVGLSVSNPAAVEARGDVNADGTINVLDAQLVARSSVGLETGGRVGEAAPGGCPEVEQSPSAVITAPADRATFAAGNEIEFTGDANDPQEGKLGGDAVAWKSSLDGQLGTSTAVTASGLSTGTHTVTMAATDIDGNQATDEIQITVEEPETVDMDIVDNAFVDPEGRRNENASVTIKVGDTVRWTYDPGGSTSHTVTSGEGRRGNDGDGVPPGGDPFDSGNLSPGDTFEVTFETAGTWTYFCRVHPDIMFDATVIVEER